MLSRHFVHILFRQDSTKFWNIYIRIHAKKLPLPHWILIWFNSKRFEQISLVFGIPNKYEMHAFLFIYFLKSPNPHQNVWTPLTKYLHAIKIVYFLLKAQGDIPGCIEILATLFSALLMIATLPFSLFICFKVVSEFERAVIFRMGRLR